MERTFTTTTAGITALHLPAGRARVTVDPAAKTAIVRLHTQDAGDSPAADAIRNARHDTGQGLSVIVPDNGSGGGGNVTVISGGRFSNVSISNGTVTINGVRVSGDGRSSRGITADVTVPPGTELVFRSTSSDLDVTGPLAGLDAVTVSGDITAGMVAGARVQTTSGDIELSAVSEQLDARTVSGDIEVGTYSGGQAALNSVSGDVELAATQAASGALSAQTVSGDVRLRGAGHLHPRVSSVSGRVRS